MKKVRVRPGLITQNFGSELIVINGLQDKICILNQTGAVIFSALKTPLDKEQLLQLLSESFTTQREELVQDVDEYLQEMESLNLLQEVP